MNRKQEINKILHDHIDVNKHEDYTNYKNLIKDIDKLVESEIIKVINYIGNYSEIPIPVEKLFSDDKTHITKKKYGKILLEILCTELKNKFIS